MMKVGTVKEWHDDKDFGYISRPGHEDVYISGSDALWGWRPRVGDEVAYELYKDRQGPRARGVVRVEGRRR